MRKKIYVKTPNKTPVNPMSYVLCPVSWDPWTVSLSCVFCPVLWPMNCVLVLCFLSCPVSHVMCSMSYVQCPVCVCPWHVTYCDTLIRKGCNKRWIIADITLLTVNCIVLLWCIVFYCTVLYCTVLYCIVLYCILL